MATYFSDLETQRNMMMMYMNYASSSSGAVNSQPPNSNESQQDILSYPGGSQIGLHGFNSALMQPTGDTTGLVVLQQGQGLSLSLGTPRLGFPSYVGPNQLISGEENGGNVPFNGNHVAKTEFSTSSYGISRTLANSKYLKAAQQLLDEVVHVRITLKEHNFKRDLANNSKNGGLDPSANAQDSSKNELSATEKQDLQNKLSKLLSMLDGVDQRYKQYYEQMQIVVSSFDMVLGFGAAKPYTGLALQTISRHFRSLRDAINCQIQLARKSLGDQDASSNSKGITISRLRYIDQKLKQHRALQHLGMTQHHAWRPQRGLPENAVSVLRAWLFEHFLNPYPKDSEKIMLARQAGLTRSQVSNWFINARVRLWKPMVEEMYKEETGDAEMDSTSSKATHDHIGDDVQQTATSMAIKRDSYEAREIQEDQNSYAYDDMSELERFGNGVSLTLGLQRCPVVSIDDHHSFVTMRDDDDVYDAFTIL